MEINVGIAPPHQTLHRFERRYRILVPESLRVPPSLYLKYRRSIPELCFCFLECALDGTCVFGETLGEKFETRDVVLEDARLRLDCFRVRGTCRFERPQLHHERTEVVPGKAGIVRVKHDRTPEMFIGPFSIAQQFILVPNTYMDLVVGRVIICSALVAAEESTESDYLVVRLFLEISPVTMATLEVPRGNALTLRER